MTKFQIPGLHLLNFTDQKIYKDCLEPFASAQFIERYYL